MAFVELVQRQLALRMFFAERDVRILRSCQERSLYGRSRARAFDEPVGWLHFIVIKER